MQRAKKMHTTDNVDATSAQNSAMIVDVGVYVCAMQSSAPALHSNTMPERH